MKYIEFGFAKTFILLTSVYCFSLATVATPHKYQNGNDLMLANLELAKQENGFFIDVPIDYQFPEKGNTSIYAYFYRNYNPSLPTLAFFMGGPGQSSHNLSDGLKRYVEQTEYNVLIFDQRGIAFSRPNSVQLWESSDFYSSKNTAQDLNEIREKLNIKQLSVYGVSYGTVAATIYAHLFPDSTRSLILEGAVFDGVDERLSKDNFMLNIIQKFYDNLSTQVKDKLARVSNDIIVSKRWFPQLVEAYLTASGSYDFKVLSELFIRASAVSDQMFQSEFLKLHSQLFSSNKNVKNNLDESLVNFMLLVKEFGASQVGGLYDLELYKGRVQKKEKGKQNIYFSFALDYGLKVNQPSTFRADQYPVKVPTYYLSGTRDGAAITPWAMLHWKLVPQDKATLVLLRGGGHSVTGLVHRSQKADGFEQSELYYRNIFLKMVNAQAISENDLSKLNSKGSLKFVMTTKNNSLNGIQNYNQKTNERYSVIKKCSAIW